jgi:tRNA threonylcarbamoyladenosine biosynthesis protein TsaE
MVIVKMKEQATYAYVAADHYDTERLAHAIARVVTNNTVIALDGDLGAGKTTFAKMLAAHLGVKEVVNSPTFTIIKEYEGDQLSVFHMDVYRINSAQAEQLGLDEYFYGGGVTMVEWASLIDELLPTNRLELMIMRASDSDSGESERRTFIIRPHGSPYVNWCEQWFVQGFTQKLENG